MRVDANVQVKNEALLLEEILPEWETYPIDHFVFFDDNSTDGTVDVIKEQLESDRYTIIRGPDKEFHEARNRSTMLEYSREINEADIVISIDADELLSECLIDDFDAIMRHSLDNKVYLFQWNLVNGLTHYRTDPSYFGNYRDFIFPLKHTNKFDMTLGNYHSPRTPTINLPASRLDDKYGFVHLQSVDVRFYALKQLWYKIYEYVNYHKTVDEINAAYDPVVNGLNFQPVQLPPDILYWDSLDVNVFSEIVEQRNYIEYIKENNVPELITFGEEYLR